MAKPLLFCQRPVGICVFISFLIEAGVAAELQVSVLFHVHASAALDMRRFGFNAGCGAGVGAETRRKELLCGQYRTEKTAGRLRSCRPNDVSLLGSLVVTVSQGRLVSRSS